MVNVYRALTGAERDKPLTPSAEWLVDNFHIVEEQLREIRHDLPRRFYRELPKLETGAFENYPRIYNLAFSIQFILRTGYLKNYPEPVSLRRPVDWFVRK